MSTVLIDLGLGFGIASAATTLGLLVVCLLALAHDWLLDRRDRQPPAASPLGPWLTDPLETLFSWPARTPDHERHVR